MRKIAIVLGSESDLSQCNKGLKLLSNTGIERGVEVVGIYIRSQHRNTPSLQQVLTELSQMKIDAIIAGGWLGEPFDWMLGRLPTLHLTRR